MNIKVWIIDDDDSIRWVLQKVMHKAGIETRLFSDANSALKQLAKEQPDVILSDIRMPDISGLELLKTLGETHPDLPVIIMTAHSDLDSAVSAYHGGAFEYLPKPFDVQEAVDKIIRASQINQMAVPSTSSYQTSEIIGEAPAMQDVFRAIGKLSRSNITVLITGESGTGKELVAKALHNSSERKNKPFVAINTAAIPHDLLESELFGHERGAFTGANERRIGRFEQADGGTLFLDEIGDMPADLQTRLLRVLADGRFHRVGGRQLIKSDVRVLAATHQDLQQKVLSGDFREDLYHRLNVFHLPLPTLRERKEDISMLLQHFLEKVATELGERPKQVHQDALGALVDFDWPGNVRQLENVARWLMVMAAGSSIHLTDLPEEILNQDIKADENQWQEQLKSWARLQIKQQQDQLAKYALAEFERSMIEVALEGTGGKKYEAAKLLGWGRNTLTRKIQTLGIDTDS